MKTLPQHLHYDQQPFLIIWETTRACDLACAHCRASADRNPSPDELSHKEALRLIDEVKQIGTPILIFSGGDCLKREDLPELIAYAKSLGLRTGAIPAVTPNLTDERLEAMKDAGLDQIAFSLDAANAKDHDAFRRVEGVFEQTLRCLEKANQIGLRTQLNSLINVHNQNQLTELFDIAKLFGIVFWEIFFLVPTGRGQSLPVLSAEKFEETFEKIYEISRNANFIIKITEAPHYRRFCHEQAMMRQTLENHDPYAAKYLPDDLYRKRGLKENIGRAPDGVNSGKGFAFISYQGDIMPSGFLPISAGNLRKNSLIDVYRNAPLFRELRDSSLLKGRCGVCSYKNICGGSRARAYALTGDYLGEDPYCAYQPTGIGEKELVH